MKHQIINFYLNKMLNSRNTPLSPDNRSVVIFDNPMGILNRLTKLIESKNFLVLEKYYTHNFNAYGVYNYDDKTIFYRPFISLSQRVIVLTHETAHLLYKHAEEEHLTDREIINCEIEANLSTLIVLCNICTNKKQNYIFDITKGSLLLAHKMYDFMVHKSSLFNYAFSHQEIILNTAQYLTRILKG